MTTTTTTHEIDRRWNGPAGVANGGFASGAFAQYVGGTATVRLESAPTLGVAHRVEQHDDLVRVVSPDGVTVATVTPVDEFVLTPPVVPSYDEALAARRAHPLRGIAHPLSNCVVCGPDRVDGMGVTAGPHPDLDDVMIAPFEPREEFAVGGLARIEAVWGALDCPSYPARLMRERRFALAGELTGHVVRDVAVGERLVAVGWATARGRRSHRTAVAIVDAEGRTVASSRAVWVEIAT